MRNVLCWIACVWLTEPGIAGSPGYLTRVGPVPLRFLSAPSAAAKAALPPLDLGGAVSAEDLAATNRLATAGLAGNRPTDGNSSSAPSLSSATPPDNRSLTPSAGAALLPQVATAPSDTANPAGPTADKFVRFFMPIPMGTNGTGYVVAPMSFSPPIPATAAPVSRATYRTPSN